MATWHGGLGAVIAMACGRVGFDPSDVAVDSPPPCTEPWSAPLELALGDALIAPSVSGDLRELYLADTTLASNLWVSRRDDTTQPWRPAVAARASVDRRRRQLPRDPRRR